MTDDKPAETRETERSSSRRVSRPTTTGDKSSETDYQSTDADLTPHPLVAKFRPDPNVAPETPPNLVTYRGYLGKAKDRDYVRLYLDLTLTEYYEIPREEVVSTQPVNPDDEDSPTDVRVSVSSKILKIKEESTMSQGSRFLGGPISSGHLGRGGGQPAEDCCWIIVATTGCSTSAVGGAQSAQGAAIGGQSAEDCCWIMVATTGCSTSAVGGAQAGRGAAVGGQLPADCCWIIVATTGCSTSTASGAKAAGRASSADCCWILVATTGCST